MTDNPSQDYTLPDGLPTAVRISPTLSAGMAVATLDDDSAVMVIADPVPMLVINDALSRFAKHDMLCRGLVYLVQHELGHRLSVQLSGEDIDLLGERLFLCLAGSGLWNGITPEEVDHYIGEQIAAHQTNDPIHTPERTTHDNTNS
jgi:hypothetical protein